MSRKYEKYLPRFLGMYPKDPLHIVDFSSFGHTLCEKQKNKVENNRIADGNETKSLGPGPSK